MRGRGVLAHGTPLKDKIRNVQITPVWHLSGRYRRKIMPRWMAAVQPYDYTQPFQPETHEFAAVDQDGNPCVIRMELTATPDR